MTENANGISYEKAGVDVAGAASALGRLLQWIGKAAHAPREPGIGTPVLESGYYASVLDLGGNLGLALCTDGVGTKLMVAQMMEKYDTVGIDCVAMNVNDLICVGAEPISMLDYIAVERTDPDIFEEIGKGLYEGARQANVSISGGEISQVKEMLRHEGNGLGFDLIGMGVGTVALDQLVVGREIDDDDVVIGLAANGLHSNGYTLARRTFFDAMGCTVDQHLPELGRTIGEELLRPTRIYVREAMEMLRSSARIKALINITGDGLLNLNRVHTATGFLIDSLPEPDPVFQLLQEGASVSDEEMFLTYNMGGGFCVVAPQDDVDTVSEIARKHGSEPSVIGRPVASLDGKVMVEEKGLVGQASAFTKI